jgi:WD40 repeat protein
MLTGSSDKTARLWEVQTGREVRVFSSDHAVTLAVTAFSPDGRSILTASQDFTVLQWQTDLQDAIQLVCGLLSRDLTDEERKQYGIPNDGPTCPELAEQRAAAW